MSYRPTVAEKTGLTLAHLETLIRQARAAGAADNSPVRGVIKLGGRVKELTVDVNDPPRTTTNPGEVPAYPEWTIGRPQG